MPAAVSLDGSLKGYPGGLNQRPTPLNSNNILGVAAANKPLARQVTGNVAPDGPPTMIDNKYMYQETLGKGACGAVYLYENLLTKQLVAFKFSAP